jgi:hypothetical protein
MVPGIKQVQNIADSGNRSRAAEVARNVRGYLKKNPGPSASTMPRSSPKLPAAGISGG